MTAPYGGDPPLTDEQQAILDLPWDALTLVTAGPGAGKTHTLVRRIEELVDRDDLGAGELLVLTFSRAAVRELKDRLVDREAAGRFVRAQTFDAWALELLLTVDAQTEWSARSFDDRIAAATQLMGSQAVNEWLDDLKHVVVDEVQDLVGCRREMVAALLSTYDCGFTVVGDPAQAIYGFQVTDPVARATETNVFARWLRTEFGDELVERRLTHNFRARSDDARSALHLGPILQHSVDSGVPERGDELFAQLRRHLENIDYLGAANDPNLYNLLGKDYPGTTAVLCRTNGEALLVSEAFYKHGLQHTIRRGARDRIAPDWLVRLFRSGHEAMVPWTSFYDTLAAGGLEERAAELWRRLTPNTRGRNAALDLHRIRTLIAEERLPDELTGQTLDNVTVSSIHRAKGLEFDRVLVVDPGAMQTWRNDPVELAEAARMLYVALTRCREGVWRLDNPQSMPMLLQRRSGSDRWTRRNVQKRWMRSGMEMQPGDVKSDQPAGNDRSFSHAFAFSASAVAVQDYLSERVHPGDPLVLRRVPGISNRPEDTTYVITHGPECFPIGMTSESFSHAMRTYLGPRDARKEHKWPTTIDTLRIDSVEAAAGSCAAGEAVGLGPHGVWLKPRMVGVSWFQYKTSTREK